MTTADCYTDLSQEESQPRKLHVELFIVCLQYVLFGLPPVALMSRFLQLFLRIMLTGCTQKVLQLTQQFPEGKISTDWLRKP